jgi:DinB superfamily
MNQSAQALRDHILYVLRGEGAHVTFEDFVADFPNELCGQRVEGLPYTAWQVLDHMRIAQWDILEFSRDSKHVSPKWPEGYWPPQDQIGTPELWRETIGKFRNDLKEMENLAADPGTDLLAKISHGTGQTILREALLVADHNSYHLGALVVMSRILRAK